MIELFELVKVLSLKIIRNNKTIMEHLENVFNFKIS